MNQLPNDSLIITADFLDWRQEASDDDQLLDFVSEKNAVNRNITFQHCEEIKNTKNKTYIETQTSIDHTQEQISGHTHTDDDQIQIQVAGKPNIENFIRPKKPMTDSGVSDLGSMADSQEMRMSLEMRQSQNLETVAEDMNLIVQTSGGADGTAGKERVDQNLLRDLAAGHARKCRPNSYLSSTSGVSADTGKTL